MDGTKITFTWIRPRTGETLTVESEYDAHSDAWVARKATINGEPCILSSSDMAELDYVAGDEFRAQRDSERGER